MSLIILVIKLQVIDQFIESVNHISDALPWFCHWDQDLSLVRSHFFSSFARNLYLLPNLFNNLTIENVVIHDIIFSQICLVISQLKMLLYMTLSRDSININCRLQSNDTLSFSVSIKWVGSFGIYYARTTSSPSIVIETRIMRCNSPNFQTII